MIDERKEMKKNVFHYVQQTDCHIKPDLQKVDEHTKSNG